VCANCVAQGVVYVGGAVAGLQVMAARARHRRADASGAASVVAAPPTDAATTDPPPDPR
jgi:poly(3-hydroxybutyrate) depolymerase